MRSGSIWSMPAAFKPSNTFALESPAAPPSFNNVWRPPLHICITLYVRVAIHVAAQDISCCSELTSQGGNSATAILVAHVIDAKVHCRRRPAALDAFPA